MDAGSVPSPRLARLVPDEPRWVDLLGLLLTERCEIHGDETGFVARSTEYPFAETWGAASAAAVEAAIRDARPGFRLVLGTALSIAAARDWVAEDLMIHVPGDDEVGGPSASPATGIVLVGGGLGWDALRPAPDLEEELGRARSVDRPAALAILEGRAVSVCVAAWRTPTLWDVSIETSREWRRQGLARACYLALVDHPDLAGRTPVWGAAASNEASLGMAAGLGFVPVARVASLLAP